LVLLAAPGLPQAKDLVLELLSSASMVVQPWPPLVVGMMEAWESGT